MLPNNIEIEVDYNIRERRKRFSNLPAEYRDLIIELPKERVPRQSRFLLFIAELMIKAGNAIKKQQQIKISAQKIYS